MRLTELELSKLSDTPVEVSIQQGNFRVLLLGKHPLYYGTTAELVSNNCYKRVRGSPDITTGHLVLLAYWKNSHIAQNIAEIC